MAMGRTGERVPMEELGATESMNRSTKASRGASAHRTRRLHLGTLGGCVLLALLMLFAPSAAAGPVPSVVHVYSAPYSGTPITIRTTEVVDCGTATFTQNPSFYLAPGVGRAAVNATVSTSASCGSPALPNAGQIEAAFGLSTLNFTASNGPHTITTVWNLTWNTQLHASGAGSHPGNILTAAVVEVLVQLVDLTTGGGAAPTPWTSILNTTGNANINFHGSKVVTSTINTNLTKGDVYAFLTVVEFSTVAEILAGANTGHASASINMATGGNKATLVSITRT
jgi:hypothetical protein